MRRVVMALTAMVCLAVATSPVAARAYAWLGVRIRDLSEQEMDDLASRHGIREGFGVYIVEVIEGTPAAKTGLKSGDIVVAFDGRPVTEGRMLQQLIAAAPVERDVRLTVLRSDGRQNFTLRLATMPRAVMGDRVSADFGFVLRDPDAATGTDAISSAAPSVSAVLRGSAAERAGLQVGDVVAEVNDRPVITRDAVRETLADVDPSSTLRLAVRRQGQRVDLVLTAR